MTPEEIRRQQEAQAMWDEVIKKKNGTYHQKPQNEQEQPQKQESLLYRCTRSIFTMIGFIASCQYLYNHLPYIIYFIYQKFEQIKEYIQIIVEYYTT